MQFSIWIQILTLAYSLLYFKGRAPALYKLCPGAVNINVINLSELYSRAHVKVHHNAFCFLGRNNHFQSKKSIKYIFRARLDVLYTFKVQKRVLK